MATYQELRTRSQQVRDEQNIGGNTALRVGQLLMDIVKYFYDNDMAASEYLEQHFAMVNDGTHLLNWQQSPIVILHTMGDDYDDGDFSALSQGENYYRAGFIMEANGQGGGINGETPKANVLYVNLANDTLYTWNGASFDAITSGGGGGSILNVKDNNVYNVWVGTEAELEALDGDYDDNTIYLVGTVAVAPTRYSVTTSGLTNCSVPSNTPSTATEGRSFSITVSPESGYTIDTATGTMTGGTLTKTNNQDGTVTFSTSAVTGAITITAAATKHITGITVSAGTRSGNSIPLTAVVAPSGAENVTLAWSVNDTTNFGISGSGASATLTVKSGASNSSVTITCQDTNASSGTASGTLQLTGITYDDAVPITALGAVSYVAGQNVNTYQFSVETTPANGNSPAIVWSVAATPSGVATINANTGLLTITDDCSVVVTATSGSNIASSSSIALTYAQDPNAPIVWEDANMEAFMLGKVTHANPNYITYAEAANYSNDKFASSPGTSSYQFDSIKDVVTKFNEWQYFPLLTLVDTTNWSLLEEVTMPPTVNLSSKNIFTGTAITNLVVPEGVTSLLLRCLSGPKIVSISFPSTLSSISAVNGSNVLSCPKLKVMDLSGTSITSVEWSRPNLGGVEILKFPPSLTSIGTSSTPVQLTRNSASLAYVEIGTEDGGSSIGGIYINQQSGHDVSVIVHSTTPPAMSWGNNFISAFYVPDSAVEDYKSATGWSSFASKIKGISELPTGWDTPSTNE